MRTSKSNPFADVLRHLRLGWLLEQHTWTMPATHFHGQRTHTNYYLVREGERKPVENRIAVSVIRRGLLEVDDGPREADSARWRWKQIAKQ